MDNFVSVCIPCIIAVHDFIIKFLFLCILSIYACKMYTSYIGTGRYLTYIIARYKVKAMHNVKTNVYRINYLNFYRTNTSKNRINFNIVLICAHIYGCNKTAGYREIAQVN